MGYALSFWKPRDGVTASPRSIDDRIAPGELLDELETLPVDTVTTALQRVLPDFDDTPLVERPGGAIEITGGAQFFRFEFRGPGLRDEIEAVWQIMRGFGCVCYDPQTDTLYARDHALDIDRVAHAVAAATAADAKAMPLSAREAQRDALQTLLGCGGLVVVGAVFGAAVIAAISYLLT